MDDEFEVITHVINRAEKQERIPLGCVPPACQVNKFEQVSSNGARCH